MTTITSSIAFFTSTINSAQACTKKPAAGDLSLLAPASGAAGNSFEAAFLLDINSSSESSDYTTYSSSGALYSAADQKTARDKLEDTVGQLFAYLNDMVAGANHTQADNSPSSASSAVSSTEEAHAGYSASFVGDPNSIGDMLANEGPLPKFLRQVESQEHMDAQHRHSLENIAWQFRNANDTPDTVHQIEDALDAAGISETPVA